MVSLKIFNSVVDELRRIEQEKDVRVLYACESGSRAWGFASQDSDYDVRFIYVHRRDWYLGIEERRDVIGRPIADGLDFSGWELRKTLRLLNKSNPALLEWLKSPVVYAQDEQFIRELRALASGYYSAPRCFYHYLHMAYGNARSYLAGEEVWTKKFLYVLRPILACRWIESGLGQVPMLFEELLNEVVPEREVKSAIAGIVARKRAGDELARGPKIPVLSAFLDAEFPRLEALHFEKESRANSDALNRLFQEFCLGAPALQEVLA